MTPRIAFIGDLTVDIYPQAKNIRLGGSSLNSSMWAGRLGAMPAILAAVGEDRAGKKYVAKLKREGIESDRVKVLRGQTSAIEIFTDGSGERRYGEWKPGVLANYHLDPQDFSFLKHQNAAALTVYGPTKHLLDELVSFGSTRRRKKPLLVVDFADFGQLKKDMHVVESCIHAIDILVFGLDKDADEALINQLKDIAAQTGKLIVVTLGRWGSLAYAGNRSFVQPARRVKVKDTTGAGDAFLAGFLISYLKTKNIKDSLVAGTELASRAIQKLGAY